ncbi:MAG: ABC transporter ATP-binding protein [Rubrobacteraceae bacterium]|nr:ABC transporter ATP-binding protein [Rubrobacteraceae bacterium]
MSEGNAGGHVQLTELTKRYGAFEAVRGIDLDIPPGEFFCLLGPSGCGKTTTLRMIAGFERPSGGRVLLDGKDVSGTPPNRRNVNTVFQNYALFSHLTVAENVAFGLRFTRTSKDETRTRVGEALSLVQMQEFRDRKPHQLSGGQQQRVALARALILNPSVLLLDEPLGALDAKLRKTLQVELKALQEQVGVTFVYVTHDQEEALTMADRLAVMSGGRVEQVGSPREVYEEPASAYVADFLGVSNLLEAEAVGTEPDGRCRVRVGELELLASQGHTSARGPVKVVVRPERVRVEAPKKAGENRLPGKVERVVYAGAISQLVVTLERGTPIQCMLANDGADSSFDRGAPVSVCLPCEALRVLRTDATETQEENGTSPAVSAQATTKS